MAHIAAIIVGQICWYYRGVRMLMNEMLRHQMNVLTPTNGIGIIVIDEDVDMYGAGSIPTNPSSWI